MELNEKANTFTAGQAAWKRARMSSYLVREFTAGQAAWRTMKIFCKKTDLFTAGQAAWRGKIRISS